MEKSYHRLDLRHVSRGRNNKKNENDRETKELTLWNENDYLSKIS